MCEVESVQQLLENEAKTYEGIFRVFSNKDNFGRTVAVMNQPGTDSLLWIIKEANGTRHTCAVLPEDARQFCIGVLDLIDGKVPVVGDAWSPNRAIQGPVKE